MIEDSKTANKNGVPLLSKIPLLGALFCYHNYDKSKTEFLLLLTPHIITDIEQSNAVTGSSRRNWRRFEKTWRNRKKSEKPGKKK